MRDSELHIGQDAVGTLELSDFRLNGSITAKNNPSLTGLVFKSDGPLFRKSDTITTITLSNMAKLKNFSFPDLGEAGSLILRDLAALEVFEMPSLYEIRDTLQIRDIPSLQHFKPNLKTSSSPFAAGKTEIKNVGLSSLDEFFNSTLPGRSMTVEDVSNVKTINILNSTIDNLSILGKGNLVLNFGCPDCKYEGYIFKSVLVKSLTVSGLGDMHRNQTRDGYTTVTLGNFTARQNSFKYLPLDFFNLTSLYVLDNPDLESMSYDWNSWNYPWKDIVIKGNPKLRMTSIARGSGTSLNATADKLMSTFIWPDGPVSTMVFDGTFDNLFL